MQRKQIDNRYLNIIALSYIHVSYLLSQFQLQERSPFELPIAKSSLSVIPESSPLALRLLSLLIEGHVFFAMIEQDTTRLAVRND